MNTTLHLETPDGRTTVTLTPGDTKLALSDVLAHRGHPLGEPQRVAGGLAL